MHLEDLLKLIHKYTYNVRNTSKIHSLCRSRHFFFIHAYIYFYVGTRKNIINFTMFVVIIVIKINYYSEGN